MPQPEPSGLPRLAACLLATVLYGCSPGVIRPPVMVPQSVAADISSVRIDMVWPAAKPEMHGYGKSRMAAAGEGAESALSEGASESIDSLLLENCTNADCLAIPLLLPVIVPLAALGNAIFSDSAAEVAAQEQTIFDAMKGLDLEQFLHSTLNRVVASRTPYTMSATDDADAVLLVRVLPLKVSGENLERQNVRVILTFDVSFMQRSANGLVPVFTKQYLRPYPVTSLRDLAENIDEFRSWLPKAAQAIVFAVAEDLYTGFDARLSKFEVIDPAVNIVALLGGPGPVIADTLNPVLLWTPVADTERSKLPEPKGDLTYEIRIFEYSKAPERISHVMFDELAMARAALTAEPVYAVSGLTESQHRLAQALGACADYLWEVRARLVGSEQSYLSDWRGYYLEQADSGMYRQWLPWFRTPCN